MKLNVVAPENFEKVQKELEEVLEQDVGAQKDQLQAECERSLKAASERVEKVKLDRQKVADAEEKEKEKEEVLKRKVEELTDLVDIAEAKNDLLKESVDPLLGDTRFDQRDLALALSSVDEYSADAAAGHKACMDFINESALGQASPEFHYSMETRTAIVALFKRMAESGGQVQELVKKARSAADEHINKVVAHRLLDQKKELFDKYADERDGSWTREELATYAKEECSIELTPEMLDRVWRSCADEGDECVPSENFYLVESVIGAARGMRELQEKRAEREQQIAQEAAEKEKRREQVEPERKALQEKIVAIAVIGETLERETVEAEKTAATLTSGKEVVKMSTDDLRKLGDEAEKSVNSGKAKLEEITDKASALEEEDIMIELASYRQEKLGRLRAATVLLTTRLKKLGTTISHSRTAASKRDSLEIGKLKAQLVGPVKKYIQDEKLGRQELFAKFAEEDGNGVTEAGFLGMMELCGVTALQPEQISRFFHFSSQGNGRLSESVFCKMFAVMNKVVSGTVMTSEFVAHGSKVMRRLEVGEVLEVLEGPTLEESVGVMRLRAKSVKDGNEGWVSVASNLGTKYLEEVLGNENLDVYRVLKATNLTDGLDSNEVVRELKEGEVLEKIEFPKINLNSVLRLRAKAKEDGKSGWATVSEGDDVFLQLA